MTLKAKSSSKSKRIVFTDDGAEVGDEIGQFQHMKAQERKSHKRKFTDGSGTEKNSANKKPAIDSGEKPDWKKFKEQKRELRVKRRQEACGGNDIYELGVKAKKIWEEVRREDCPAQRKTELCQALYSLIQGKTKTLIYAHDTVRVIETLLSVGDEHYRTRLFFELKDDILNLSKNKYSRFFVTKLLRCGTKEQRNSIIQAMSGHVVEIMRHKIACETLELAYNDYANAKQRSHMIQEFYGPRFRHFKEDISNLEAALQKYPDMKDQILMDVSKALQPIIDKGVFTNTLIHTVMKEYLYVCSDAGKAEIIENIREGGLLPILHTRDGARVAMLCLWNGTPKDRKVILKSFKGKYAEIATDEHGFMVLLSILDCVDDTVIVQKVALAELMTQLNELVENDHGKKVLKYMVSPRSKLFFHPTVLSVLQDGDNNAHSKKDAELKYGEMQKYISEPVLKLIHGNIKRWFRNPHWTLFVGSALQTLSGDSIIPIFESLAEICAEPFVPNIESHFLEVSYMCKMVSFIIKCDHKRREDGKPVFSSHLVAAAETELSGWALCNRGCFMLVNLLETEIPEIVKEVTSICLPIKEKLAKRNFKGAAVLFSKI